jgi:hypothetical protein
MAGLRFRRRLADAINGSSRQIIGIVNKFRAKIGRARSSLHRERVITHLNIRLFS